METKRSKKQSLSVLQILNVSTIFLQLWSILFFESWVHFNDTARSTARTFAQQ
jgi:hypothetical protein